MKAVLAVAAALAIAPVAQAQASGCPLLQGIVDGAAAGFPELRGEELSEDWFESTLYMTGADECSVNTGDSNLFYCVWGFDTPEAANSLATALSDAGKECLAGWALEDTGGSKSSNNLTISKGLNLSGVGGHAGTRVLVFAESFEGSQESQVTIEVRR
jgi:hypothetical protein